MARQPRTTPIDISIASRVPTHSSTRFTKLALTPANNDHRRSSRCCGFSAWRDSGRTVS
jgi:hypothetical protein